MSNLHRIQWIDKEIRAHRYPNCHVISSHFEISYRQASRDIEYLRYSLQAPIAYSQENQGYYYEDGAFVLPALYLSDEEKNLLSFLAEKYSTLHHPQGHRIAEIFDRLIIEREKKKAIFKDPPIISPPQLQSISCYHHIREAIQKNVKIEIEYTNKNQERRIRIVHPYQFLEKYNNFYLIAWCELKNALRIFRLDRIQSMKTTSDGFTKDNTQLQIYLHEEDPHFRALKPYTANIKISQESIPINPPYECVQVSQDIVQFQFYESEKFIQFLFTLPHFQVQTPKWLKEKVRDKFHVYWMLHQ